MFSTWDASPIKVQLRLARQRLRELQDRNDSQGFIIRKDIATLLRQQKVWLARAKAHRFLVDGIFTNLLERLEMHIKVLLEYFNEADLRSSLSPIVLEATATIVYAAPNIDIRELQEVRSLLVNYLWVNPNSSSPTNSGSDVSPTVIKALTSPSPSAFEINACLRIVALDFNIDWEPEPSRHDIVNSLSEVLNSSSLTIDLSTLRSLCRYGIPDEPAWLRPRIWKLFLSMVSPTRMTWPVELRKQRDDYYDLVRRLLELFSASEAPSTPISHLDSSLLDISKQLARIPSNLFLYLEKGPNISGLCPLDSDAPDNIRISCANNLDMRLAILKDKCQTSGSVPTPKIQIEAGSPKDIPSDSKSATRRSSATLLQANILDLPYVHPRHASALLRILYLHATINPGILSPHVPSLLIPLYTVFARESEPECAAHIEADTFWLFEAMMAEFSEFEDEHVSDTWLKKFGERVAWADEDLYEFLCAQRLDPGLPHYSYRWLATLLTHSLPLSSIIPVWDVLFSRPMRSRGANDKMDHLLDVCTAMLLCTKSTPLQLGRGGLFPRSLRSEHESMYLPQYSNAFTEGMTLLQNYPIELAGGVDRVLQTASDLLQRRQDGQKSGKDGGFGLVLQIKETMSRGFTNQQVSSSESEKSGESNEDGVSPTETLSTDKAPTFTSRLATTVWKGITNQTAMEPPPSPPPSTHSLPTLPEGPVTDGSQWSSNKYNSLFGYAEKLKDSDAVAVLSKVSSNWKAKTLMATWGRAPGPQQPSPGSASQKLVDQDGHGNLNVPSDTCNDATPSSSRRSSIYSPPPRPVYFHPPRDSYIPPDTERMQPPSIPISPVQPASDAGIISRTKASLMSLRHSAPLAPRPAPRPLLLSSSSLITPTSQAALASRALSSAPTMGSHSWDHSAIGQGGIHRDSLSLVSSSWDTSDRDSDFNGSSRRIPLNRKSISPLAPSYRAQHSKNLSRASFASSDGGYKFPVHSRRDLSLGYSTDSQVSSPGPGSATSPQSPTSNVLSLNGMHVEHGPVLLDSPEDQMPPISQPTKPLRRKNPSEHDGSPEDRIDSVVSKTSTSSVRPRARRHQTQPTGHQLQHEQPWPETQVGPSSPNFLKVEWVSDDQDMSVTPTATNFDLTCPQTTPSKPAKFSRKVSTERRVSGSQRSRKTPSDGRDAVTNDRDSAAEGDDEGYDDLLSAYESEEGVQFPAA